MAERGISVDHSTINRWILKYSPQLEIAATLGFKSFYSAAKTLAGVELIAMIKKGHFHR